jgi:glycosyltransferase involved in cell wall biosynthesis
MKIAFLTTDNREQQAKYDLNQPFFGTAPAALLEGFTELKDEIEIHVVSCSKRRMSVPDKLAPNIFFHQPIVHHLGWGRTAFAGCAIAVRKLLAKLRPEIVHGQGTERDCAISAVYCGFPNVLTIHGNMQRIYRMKLLGANSYYWLASTLETHALGRTAGVFCNSMHTRSLVEGRTRKTWMVPNPLRLSFLDPPAPAHGRNPVPVFLVVGVVTRLKRPLEILRTMKSLFDAGHRFKIRFVGALSTDYSYAENFQQLLADIRHQDYAEHLGTLNEADLIHTMDEADALIHFPEEEAFGLVVAEALARNLKVFAARIGGIPDILEGTDGSEMFEDFAALGSGIARWLAEDCPRPIGNPALMRERYAPAVIARKHMEIYREVLSNK